MGRGFDSKHDFTPPNVLLGFSFVLGCGLSPQSCRSRAYHLARAPLPLDVGYLFKKLRYTKGTFYAKMGSIKDRNYMDLTEAEDIKKRW